MKRVWIALTPEKWVGEFFDNAFATKKQADAYCMRTDYCLVRCWDLTTNAECEDA